MLKVLQKLVMIKHRIIFMSRMANGLLILLLCHVWLTNPNKQVTAPNAALVGEALVPYYRQILPVFNLLKHKNGNYPHSAQPSVPVVMFLVWWSSLGLVSVFG
jgi:hypothetical protein